jgi:hypothetical protein
MLYNTTYTTKLQYCLMFCKQIVNCRKNKGGITPPLFYARIKSPFIRSFFAISLIL